MKITLDLPDGMICGFFDGVAIGDIGMRMVSYLLDSEDMKDGNVIKLPRERHDD